MTLLFILLVVLVVIPYFLGTGKKVLIAFDQLINAYFKGWPDETLSSRAWRWEENGKRSWPRKLIDAVFFLEKDHCKESYENEKLGRQLPPKLRDNSAL